MLKVIINFMSSIQSLVEEKKCSTCKKIKSIHLFSLNSFLLSGRRSACRDCDKAYGREYVRKNKEKMLAKYKKRYQKVKNDPLYLLKSSARAKIKNEIRYGRIIKTPCEVCGEVKVQGHHVDYNKPLEVKWLCVKHHREQHLKEKSDRDFIQNNK